MTNTNEERNSVLEGSNIDPIQFKMGTLHKIASSLQENLQKCIYNLLQNVTGLFRTHLTSEVVMVEILRVQHPQGHDFWGC